MCKASDFGGRTEGLDPEDQLDEDVKKLEKLDVCLWLRQLSWRIPLCDVILVATQCDLAPPDELDDIAERMEKACRDWLRRWGAQGMKVNLEANVALTSCEVPKGFWPNAMFNLGSAALWSISLLAQGMGLGKVGPGRSWGCDYITRAKIGSSVGLLNRMTHVPETGTCRGVTMSLPRGWDAVLTMLDALGTGR